MAIKPEVLEKIRKSSTPDLIKGIERIDAMLTQNIENNEKYLFDCLFEISDQKDEIIKQLHKRGVVDDAGYSEWLGAQHSLITPEMKC